MESQGSQPAPTMSMMFWKMVNGYSYNPAMSSYYPSSYLGAGAAPGAGLAAGAAPALPPTMSPTLSVSRCDRWDQVAGSPGPEASA